MSEKVAPAGAMRSRSRERSLIALIVVAAWSMVPPYLGPLVGLELDVPSRLEIIDHIVPGLCAVASASFALSFARRGEFDSIRALAALGVCALAGLFQTVSHATLVLDAGGPLQPVGSVVLHATVGPVLLGLSVWLLLAPVHTDPG